MTPEFADHRETLRLLHKAAGGNINKATEEERQKAVQAVWGEAADESLYRRFLAEYEHLWSLGVRLAEQVVTYGLGVVPLVPETCAALAVAQPYAEQLQVRRAAEAQRVAAGGVGSVAYYSTYTGGDVVEARRLQAEARARERLA